MRRMAVVAAAMVLGLTLLIWAGVHNARERRLKMQTAQTAGMTVRKESGGSEESGTGETAPKMEGKIAPAFTLVDLDGKKVSLSDFKGKPVFVNFWATWCAPCKLEMPWIQEFSEKYKADGLVVLGISTDDAGKSLIAATTKRLGVSYPILLKNDTVEDAYGGIDMMPQSFYVDRTGKVLLQTAGITDGQGGKDELEANIKKLLAAGAP